LEAERDESEWPGWGGEAGLTERKEGDREKDERMKGRAEGVSE
jgi:hypothetical protein